MNFNTCLPIKEINQSLFIKKYLANCIGCSFCDDICCSYGCPADLVEVDRIISYADQLETIINIPSSSWFKNEITVNPDYPSGKVRYTKVYNNKCVFHKNGYRGCLLHSFCIEKGIDIHLLKPMVCCLFPVTWEKECLLASEFLEELPCKDSGISIFEAQKNELMFYLGGSFVTELEGTQDK